MNRIHTARHLGAAKNGLLALITCIAGITTSAQVGLGQVIIIDPIDRDETLPPPPPPPPSHLPPYVRVRSIATAGSGCPAGSVASNLSPDQQSFSLLFDRFLAETGPGVPFSARRANCMVNVDLDFPQGWSYAVARVNLGGYVSLERGVSATVQVRHYFQGSSSTGTMRQVFNGPEDRDYSFLDVPGMSAQDWSPCGATRSLNLNLEVRLSSTAAAATGLITIESHDPYGGLYRPLLSLMWRRC